MISIDCSENIHVLFTQYVNNAKILFTADISILCN